MVVSRVPQVLVVVGSRLVVVLDQGFAAVFKADFKRTVRRRAINVVAPITTHVIARLKR